MLMPKPSFKNVSHTAHLKGFSDRQASGTLIKIPAWKPELLLYVPSTEIVTQSKLVAWRLQLDGHDFERALGVGDRQGGLACCGPWGCKDSDTSERPN